MQQPTDHDTELARTVIHTVARLIVGTKHADHPEIAAAITELLNAVAAYNRTHAERPSDEPLRRAIARL